MILPGSTEITAEWQDVLGNTKGSLDLINDVLEMNYVLVENDVHVLEFEMSPCTVAKRIQKWDRIILRYRDCKTGQTTIEGDTCWFIMRIRHLTNLDGYEVYHFYAESVDNQLSRRVIPQFGDTSLTDKTGTAGDIMIDIFNENYLGANPNGDPSPIGAYDPLRDMSAYMSADPPIGLGAATENTHAWEQHVINVMQELAQNSAELGVPLFFNIIYTQAGLRFKVFENVRGTDRTTGVGTVNLSVQNCGLLNSELVIDCTDEVNVVWNPGRDRNTDRSVGYHNDTARSQTNPFARSEKIVDGRNVDSGNEQALLDEMARASVNEGRPLRYVEATFNNGAGTPFRYNQHWRWGDIVNVTHGRGFSRVTFSARVSRVRVSIKQGVISVGEEFEEGTGILLRESSAGV